MPSCRLVRLNSSKVSQCHLATSRWFLAHSCRWPSFLLRCCGFAVLAVGRGGGVVDPARVARCVVGAPLYRGYAVFAAAVAAFWCLAPPVLVTVALAPLFVVFLRAAWMRSPDQAAPSPWSLVRGPPLVALASAHALALARAQFEVIARGALLTTVGTGFAYAILRHGEPSAFAHMASVTQSVSVPVTVALSGTMIGPMLRNERRSRWLLDACAVGASSRAAAIAIVAATSVARWRGPCASGSSLLGFDAASRLALSVETAVAGACLSVVTQWCLRFSLRDDGRDSARVILSLLAVSAGDAAGARSVTPCGAGARAARSRGRLGRASGSPTEPNARRFPPKAAPQ